jgi:hypothetical protein
LIAVEQQRRASAQAAFVILVVAVDRCAIDRIAQGVGGLGRSWQFSALDAKPRLAPSVSSAWRPAIYRRGEALSDRL